MLEDWNDYDHDCYITVDVLQYLVENYPKLTLKQRKAIGILVMNDDEFNLDPIYDQIDEWVGHYSSEDDSAIIS